MRKLLWVGDAVCPSGFAKCTHEILDVLRHTWDVSVLGINYLGDPHSYPYPIYPAIKGYSTDAFGVRRLPEVVAHVQPDVVLFQNDPWNIPPYLESLKRSPWTPRLLAGALAVDGLNCRGTALKGLDLAIFWTQFGLREARLGGYNGSACVVPLGCRREHFAPRDRVESRCRLGMPEEVARRAFLVGNVNRNQPRKRLDLTLEYFADFVKRTNAHDAFLFLHVAPTGDTGYDCQQLAQYYGVARKLILVEPPVFVGATEDQMVDTYNAFDVQVSTTQGEGWGLTTMEGMACGIPQVVPNWAALGEWTEDGVCRVPCPTRAATPGTINAIGGIPDKEQFVSCLQVLYESPEARAEFSARGIDIVSKPDYRWENIGAQYDDALNQVWDDKIALEEKEAAHA